MYMSYDTGIIHRNSAAKYHEPRKSIYMRSWRLSSLRLPETPRIAARVHIRGVVRDAGTVVHYGKIARPTFERWGNGGTGALRYQYHK